MLGSRSLTKTLGTGLAYDTAEPDTTVLERVHTGWCPVAWWPRRAALVRSREAARADRTAADSISPHHVGHGVGRGGVYWRPDRS